MKLAELAVQTLDALLENGSLKSKVDEYLVKMRTKGSYSIYHNILAKKGYGAAEQALKDWSERLCLHEFAESIEQTAVGMRDLARADLEDDHVKIVLARENHLFPLARSLGSDGAMVALLNLPRHRGCGCNLPKGAEIFGEHGTLPLKAVILGCASKADGDGHRLSLVFPAREKAPWSDEGYTSVTIHLDGVVDGETCFPRLTADDYFSYSLGLVPAEKSFTALTCAGGTLDDRIGFPGAGEYLAKHISKLGPYLSTISQVVGKDHR